MNIAKYTKTQLGELEGIRDDLRRGIDYLLRDEVAGIAERIDYRRVNLLDYTINNGSADHIRVMHKQAGSNIAGLYQALDTINQILKRKDQ